MNSGQLQALMPLIVLSLTAVVLMLQASVKRDEGKAWLIVLLGLLLAGWSVGQAWETMQTVTPLLRVDRWSLLISLVLILAALATLILARASFSRQGERKEEFYLLLILATLGAVVLAQSSHVATLLLGLELLSIALYAMIAFPEKGLLPLEAAIKYLVLSAGASSILLFGFALIYAASGGLGYAELGASAADAYADAPVALLAGTALVLVGLGFKLSVVPFHMWTPDVYQGAPTAVTAFLATVSKGAVFVALSRLYLEAQLFRYPSVTLALSVLAAASMLAGNLLALQQNDLKRLLAYSSIAHFGYLLVLLICIDNVAPSAPEAVLFYLTAYIVTTLAAFAVVAWEAGEDEEKTAIGAFSGLFWRRPLQAAVMTAAMLSLAGIPLTAGFIGKFYVISVGVAAGQWWLLLILLAGSAIALYYYLRVVFTMSSGEGAPGSSGSTGVDRALAWALLLLVLLLGVWPQPFITALTGI